MAETPRSPRFLWMSLLWGEAEEVQVTLASMVSNRMSPAQASGQVQ